MGSAQTRLAACVATDRPAVAEVMDVPRPPRTLSPSSKLRWPASSAGAAGTLAEAPPRLPRRGRLDLRHPRHERSVTGPLHADRHVLVGVQPVGFPPPGGEQVLEPRRRHLAQTFGSGLLQIEALVNDLSVLGHHGSLAACPLRSSTGGPPSSMSASSTNPRSAPRSPSTCWSSTRSRGRRRYLRRDRAWPPNSRPTGKPPARRCRRNR